jgi:UDP-N-acetylglucosamine 1-carboxyvinyltransferase
MSNTSDQKKIGNRIAEFRELKSMTQKELAASLHTSQSAVARMENGQQNFTTEMLGKISKVLGQQIITLEESQSVRIEGGHPLSGTITVNTSKNAAVSLLCASLLNRGKTTLKGVPKIEEVYRIIEVLDSIGVSVKWVGSNVEISRPAKLDLANIDKKAAVRTRSVLMLLGPLSHLFTEFTLPLAGGCKLGERTVRPHLFALEKLGVKIKTHHDYYKVTRRKLKPATIVLYESGDTVTENAVMAASRIPGKTTIKMASSNYMVQDLCHFLQLLGVKIEGIGSNTLVVHGKAKLDKNVIFSLSEDPIEAMMFLSLAATTNSPLLIKRCPIDFLELELLKLEKMGFKFKVGRRYKNRNGFTDLVDIQTGKSRLKALEEKIYARPFPGLNIDNLPFFVPIATRAKGTTLIHDWIYENRAIYYMELEKLRADMLLADPHRVYIKGPTQLRGAEVVCPPALRPASIILIAMLAATGTSILSNIYSINRGYENLIERLQGIGAKIEVVYGL